MPNEWASGIDLLRVLSVSPSRFSAYRRVTEFPFHEMVKAVFTARPRTLFQASQ